MHPTLEHPIENASLQHLNSFGLNARTALFSVMSSSEDALAFAQLAKAHQPMVWGSGSNVLLTKDYPGWIGKMEIKGIDRMAQDDAFVHLRVGAGENWHDCVMTCLNNHWFGLENLSLIPGTVGAAPIQNIGAYGVELKDFCTGVEAIERSSGKTIQLSAADCAFGYRSSFFKSQPRGHWIITHVHLRLNREDKPQLGYGHVQQTLTEMGISQPGAKEVSQAIIQIRRAKLPDPKTMGNAGSFFKNPSVPLAQYEELVQIYPTLPGFKTTTGVKIPAAWLIETCGWKGYRKGDAGCHAQQALVLVNHGKASGSDILALSQAIQASVEKKFSLRLEPEVNIL